MLHNLAAKSSRKYSVEPTKAQKPTEFTDYRYGARVANNCHNNSSYDGKAPLGHKRGKGTLSVHSKKLDLA